LAQFCVANKVPIYANPAAGERCHVYMLDKYLSKLPAAAEERLLLLATIGKCPCQSWFTAIPVGKNSFGKVSEMFGEAGIKEKTNHSLRAAGVSQLLASFPGPTRPRKKGLVSTVYSCA